MTEKIEVKGKKVLLGNGSILDIDGIKDGRFYNCSVISKETGNRINDILVPINSCVDSDKDGVDLESLPRVAKDTNPVDNGGQVINIDDLFEMDLEKNDIWASVKKHSKLVKVVKITQKTLHFIDNDTGKKRYVHHKSVKKIYNYGEVESSDNGDSPKSIESTEKTEKSSPEKTAKEYAESKGRDGSPVEKDKKSATGATEIGQNKQKNTSQGKVQKKKKVAVKDYLEAEITGDPEPITEIPSFINYKDEGRNVFIDIPEVGNGLKIRRIANGKVYWDSLKSGKHSTKSLKKIKADENVKIYEYK